MRHIDLSIYGRAEKILSKSPDAFRTISEVADDLALPQHVLRFWETRFTQIKPMKRGGGRRYYRPDDVELLKAIKSLLYDEGYTIRGVQKLLKQQSTTSGGDEKEEGDLAPEMAENGSTSSRAPDINAEQGKVAMNVGEFSKKNAPEKKSKGILNRISDIVVGDERGQAGSKVVADDLKYLQSTLGELLECKRLLDQTRQD